MTMDNELSRCKFCGRKPVILPPTRGAGLWGIKQFRCPSTRYECLLGGQIFNYIHGDIKRWNRRHVFWQELLVLGALVLNAIAFLVIYIAAVEAGKL